MRIIQTSNKLEILQLLKEIKVDPCGIKIMSDKAQGYLIRINGLSCISANILKQEMLSLGADAAVSRNSLRAQVKFTDCLLIGNLAQLSLLCSKLKKQPFNLKELGENIACNLANYRINNFIIHLDRFRLNLSTHTHIMGIINMTPDSFSSDGLLKNNRLKQNFSGAIEYAQKLVSEGADIIDIGGESSRPGAKSVALKEELRRVLPLIKKLSKEIKVPISIDTSKPEVAKQALDNGASLVNDITGLANKQMLKLVSQKACGIIIMHMQGKPANMQNSPRYGSPTQDIINYLGSAIQKAKEFGINTDKVIIDPGIGFGKTLEHNLELIKRLKEFKILGRPILIGTSRKSFIGKILNAHPKDRIFGTVASCILAASNGASILRVHDVKETKDALKITDRILKNGLESSN